MVWMVSNRVYLALVEDLAGSVENLGEWFKTGERRFHTYANPSSNTNTLPVPMISL